MNYKDTLNLPRTDFPMRANLPAREPEILKYWDSLALYRKLRQNRAGAPKFILHDGPPYANGEIHIGHAVNKILKDIIIKAKTLSGFNAPYVPGWDCHGLPIELQVEKTTGKAGVKVDARTFRQACRAFAAQQVESQRRDFMRLGVFGAWETPYLTMDYTFEANILRALGRVIERGHLYQGVFPVHWCTDCGSALAEAEVEYQDKTSPAIDVKFFVADEPGFTARWALSDTGHGPISVVIWTTTPWTLPANQAVALHPTFDYLLVQTPTERLVLTEALAEAALSRYGIEDSRILGRVNGSRLEGQLLKHPFYPRRVPLILSTHVTAEAGTGAVHIAPGHGQDDYHLGLRYKLPIDNPVGNDGRFVPGTALFAGETTVSANEHVIDLLQEHGALAHAAKIRHSYPHCWRHHTPLLFRATPQWFISMDRQHLRTQALTAIREVTWTPRWGEARILGMVESRPDWCISRQRNWGVPIALFVHRTTGQLHPRTVELIEPIAKRIEAEGVDAWFALAPSELLGEAAQDYEKVTDILDVWFDSGVTHACVLEADPRLGVPADLYLEGSDQHRGWFQSSLLTSVALRGTPPYQAVLTHGFTVDAAGQKMSKSRGNVVAPQQVVNRLGADILRLWVAATDYSGEMAVSDEILKRMADAYRRIRNTARYLLANLNDFDPVAHLIPAHEQLSLDRWAVDQAQRLQTEVTQAYETYAFHLIYQKVHRFCAVEMGSFYLDVTKDRMYTMPADSHGRRSAQTAMHHILEGLVRLVAPILSFTAEEVWQAMPGARSRSVFLETWYAHLSGLDHTDALQAQDWVIVLEVREATARVLERLRVAGNIGASLDAEVTLYLEPRELDVIERLADELRFALITSYATTRPYTEHPPKAIAEVLASGARIALEAYASSHPKCARCWHHRQDIGAHPNHPEICARCVGNITGKGETRRYA